MKKEPLRLLLSTIDSEYQLKFREIRAGEKTLKSAMKIAERNGLYYQFAHSLKEMDTSFPPKERWNEEIGKISGFKQTVKLLNEALGKKGIDYLVIKRCSSIPHIPRDIDIFVEKEKKGEAVKALQNRGLKCTHSDDFETSLEKKEYIKLDIYTRICYLGVDFIDPELLWHSKANEEMFGMEYPAPGAEENFLLLLVHSLFGHRSMTLLDFLHLKNLMNEIQSLVTCREYAYKKGWGNVFDIALGKLNSIRKKIYEGEIINFPYIFDRDFILKSISEIEGLSMSRTKKLFLYLSLTMDRAIEGLRNSPIYNLVKSIGPLRNSILRAGYFIKSRRGDIKS